MSRRIMEALDLIALNVRQVTDEELRQAQEDCATRISWIATGKLGLSRRSVGLGRREEPLSDALGRIEAEIERRSGSSHGHGNRRSTRG